MKKRLLSAALALAMVLTMLPLTVFADGAGSLTTGDSGKYTVNYRAKDYVFQTAVTTGTNLRPEIKAPADGWYYWGNKGVKDAPNEMIQVTNGVVKTSSATATSGTWFDSLDNAVGPTTEKVSEAEGAASKGNASYVRLLDGATLNMDKVNQASLTVDVNGKSLSLAGILQQNQAKTDANPNPNTKLATLSLVNNAKNDDGTVKAVSVTGSIAPKDQAFTLNLTNINTEASTPSLSVSATNATTSNKSITVNLTNSKMSGVTTSKQTLALKVNDAASEVGNVEANKDVDAAMTFNPGTSSVTVTGGKAGDITMNGGGSITVSDMGELGNLTITGGKTDTKDGKTTAMKWNGKITVTISGQSKVGTITEGTDNAVACDIKITNGGKDRAVGAITMTNSNSAHTITVTGGMTGTIAQNAGTLTISGGSKVGAVTLGSSDKVGALTVNVSGDDTEVAGISVAGSKVSPTVNISGGTIGPVSLGTYNKQTISGGTFTAPVQSNWLNGAVYQIQKGENEYTYTNSFQDAVDAYTNKTVADGVVKYPVITAVGAAATYELSFYVDPEADPDGATPDKAKPVVVIWTDGETPIRLPDKVNGTAITTWFMGKASTPYDKNTLFVASSTTVPVGDKLNIKTTSTASDNSNIVAVSVHKDDPNNGLSATLSGNTVRVSGALLSKGNNARTIVLEVETAAGLKYKVYTVYMVNQKELQFVSCEGPIIGLNGNRSLGVSGSVASWPLDGSGLAVANGSVEPSGLAGGVTASATVSGVTGQLQKIMKDALENSTANFNGSPAVKEAVNKVIAGISDSQVNTWLATARREAAKKANNVTNPTQDQIDEQNVWNTVHVTTYLSITASDWKQPGSGHSIALNITPYYRVEVVKSDMSSGDKPIEVKSGAALPVSSSTSDLGDVVVNLDLPANFIWGNASTMNAHHNSTYVYKITNVNGKYQFTTHHGFSPFVIDSVDPVASIDKWEGKAETDTNKRYYDSVQKAIDDVTDGGVVELLKAYTGSTSFSVTGKARTFTFKVGPNGSKEFTFTGNVIRDNTSGGDYKVQLTADNIPAPASITVAKVSNGTMTASTTSAVAGTVVTLTAKPNENYRADAPTVKTNSGAAVTLTASTTAAGVWTFTVPAGATSITVTPVFTMVSGLPFTDVSANAWYYEGVNYCYNTTTSNGIKLMQGYNETTFGVGTSHPLTRADVVTIMWNLKGRPAAGAATSKSTFSDVKSGAWYYDAVTWAANNGYANGYGDGRFGPNDPVLRDELVTFLWRFAGSPKMTTNLSAYTDGGKVLDWAQDAMRWAAGLNILSGTNSVALNGTLSPRTVAYREQVAVTVRNYHQRYK